MAGFVGICGNPVNESSAQVQQALALTQYSPQAKSSKLKHDANLVLWQSWLEFLGSPVTTASGASTAWLDGEVFDFPVMFPQAGSTFLDQVLAAYHHDQLADFLNAVDGLFVVLVYDPVKKNLLVLTDRFGLRPFYLAQQQQQLWLAQEVKCFASMGSFRVSVRHDAIDSFIALGHLLGDVTWLHDVYLVKPASIYTFEWEKNSLKQSFYWKWSDIKPQRSIKFQDAVEMISPLFRKAMESRVHTQAKRGLLLSGGLDSRAILAELYKKYPMDTFTFGTEKSRDVVIAARVAKTCGVKNTWYPVYHHDWIQGRFSGIWKTDGMLNAVHMHYSHNIPAIQHEMQVNMSGFLGDVVMGGSYLTKKKKTFLNQRPTADLIRHYYGESDYLPDATDSFFDIEKVDPYMIYNRGRRLIGMGAEEPNKTIWQRIPFFENKLMEASYSLPDEFRAGSKLYTCILLKNYPDLFAIPDAATMLPLFHPDSTTGVLLEFISTYISKAKALASIPIGFTNYPAWLQEPSAQVLLRSLLDPSKALYAGFTKRNFVTEFLEGKKWNDGLAAQVMAAVTVEVWLQQLLNKRYR
jgi:asparagine synthase (glutamine-hydrolysing)